MKISGRYRVGPKTELALRADDDVAAKVFGGSSSEEISTRLLSGAQPSAVASRLWGRTLDEMYAERSRIVGPRSLVRIVRNSR